MCELGAECRGVGGKWNGSRGSGSGAAGQPSLERHQSYTHEPGWGWEQPSSVSGGDVQFVLSAVDLEGLKFRVHSWPFAVDFCLRAGVARSRPGMSPRPSPWDTRHLGLSLDFCACSDGEQCSGMLWDSLGCSGILWGALGSSGALECRGVLWDPLGCSGIL